MYDAIFFKKFLAYIKGETIPCGDDEKQNKERYEFLKQS